LDYWYRYFLTVSTYNHVDGFFKAITDLSLSLPGRNFFAPLSYPELVTQKYQKKMPLPEARARFLEKNEILND
jgi:hypothetical protein